MAASWTRTLGCAGIADEIEQNLQFLSRPLRDLPSRHHSIQATFDQTWSLLTERERRAFRHLSVFRGGFHREAAREVAGADLETLSTLVEKSMLRHKDRYHIHELLRQFGEDKQAAFPDQKADVHQRFMAYYAAFLHRRLGSIDGGAQRQAASEIAGEWGNIRAFWQRAVGEGHREVLRQAASTYFLFCQLQSRFLEGADGLRAAAEKTEQLPASWERDLLLARLFNHEGWMRIRVGEFEKARHVLETSCSLYEKYEAAPPPLMGGDSRIPLAITAHIQGDPERAVELCEAALQDAEGRGDTQNQAFAHYGLSSARTSQGQYRAGYHHAERSSALARDNGNRWFLAYPLIERGNTARAMGKTEEAEAHYQEAYIIKKEFGDPEGMAVALSHMGEIAVQWSEFEQARDHLQKSVDMYRDLNDRGGLANSLKGLGQVAHAEGNFSTASGYFRQALDMAIEIKFWPLVFSIVVDAVDLINAVCQPSLSVMLLALIEDHPSSRHETRQQAGQLLEDIEGEMAARDFRSAVQQAEDMDMDQALSRLGSELKAAAEREDGAAEREQVLVEPLTDGEHEILCLIAKGYTNEDISDELVLALGTVKWYASQIYGKLGVSNRTEAAVQARDLDLVP